MFSSVKFTVILQCLSALICIWPETSCTTEKLSGKYCPPLSHSAHSALIRECKLAFERAIQFLRIPVNGFCVRTVSLSPTLSPLPHALCCLIIQTNTTWSEIPGAPRLVRSCQSQFSSLTGKKSIAGILSEPPSVVLDLPGLYLPWPDNVPLCHSDSKINTVFGSHH